MEEKLRKRIHFRITEELEKSLQKRAGQEEKSVSELVREILEDFLSGGDEKNHHSDEEILSLLRKNFGYTRTLAKLILDTDLRTYAMRSGLTVADKMQIDAEIKKRRDFFEAKFKKEQEGGSDV